MKTFLTLIKNKIDLILQTSAFLQTLKLLAFLLHFMLNIFRGKFQTNECFVYKWQNITCELLIYLTGHFNIDLSIGLRENSPFRTFILVTSKYRLKICELMSFKSLKQKLTGLVKLSLRLMHLPFTARTGVKCTYLPHLTKSVWNSLKLRTIYRLMIEILCKSFFYKISIVWSNPLPMVWLSPLPLSSVKTRTMVNIT